MLRFFFQRFFRRTAAERDLHEELAAHLEAEIRERIERGEAPEFARHVVLREFGNIGLVTEVTRDMWGFGGLEQLLQDVRYGLRMLRKSPGLTLAVTMMLALGIGGVTAMFTFVNGILLRPLPFPSPDRLVAIWEVPPKTTKPNVVALQNFVAWKEQSHSFQYMAAMFSLPMNLITPDESEQVPFLRVTADFFQTLGIPAMLGRTFRPGEFYRDKPQEVVLSYNTWQSRFGGRRDIIGKKISIDVSHHEIIGVMPPGFGLPGIEADLYVPLAMILGEGRNYSVIARLRPGVSTAAAKAEIAAIATRTAKADVEMNDGWSATVIPLLDQTVGSIRPILLLVFSAVCLLMLLACANIANLLLMHSSARSQEISIRLALGAGKLRIARQLLIEMLLLAILGGLAGTALAIASVDLARSALPDALHLPRLDEISVDGRVLALCASLTMLSCLLFGLAPALQTLRRDVVRELHSVTRSVTSGRSLRDTLVVAEVAIAVIVVAAAGLLMRSFLRLTRVDTGFHAENVLTVKMLLLPVTDLQYRAQTVDDMLKRIRALPGVLSAGSIGILPMEGVNAGTSYYRTDRPEPASVNRPGGDVSIITPGYFRTLAIPILQGRDFNEDDRKGSQLVAILNQSAARMLFPGENPIGKRLKVDWADPMPVVEIVGIARDIRHSTLAVAPDPCLFMPNDQQPFPFTGLVVRATTDPLALTSAIRKQIRAVDSDQGVAKVETMTQMVAGSIARPRAEALLLTLFGAIALLIACLGLYGVIAYSVTQRSRSIGIRLALGASSAAIFRGVLLEGFQLTLIGLIIGIVGTALMAQYVRSLLYEIQPADPVTLASVAGLMMVVSLFASCWPARRAMSIDPARLLRQE